jgi:hypothetical protein
MVIQFQFGGDAFSNMIWFVFFMVFMLFYQRIIVTQMLWKLEQTAEMLEGYTGKAKKIVTRKVTNNPSKELKEQINNFLEAYVIEPVNLDPYGIVKKVEHIMDLFDKKLKYFSKTIAPKLNEEEQMDLVMGLSGAMSLNQIAKIVRHYVELIRKTKNLQLAMILQMQLPMVERLSKALLLGTEALTNRWPIGDSVSPLVVTKMIGTSRVKEIEEDTVVAKKKIKGKNVIIMKAKGPGGRLGKLGKAAEDLIKKENIKKIITVDAAAKLEGERTGAIAEGIGVAIGGIGVDRSYIENIAVAKNLPLDSIVIKMSQEEAIMPMKLSVLDAIDQAIKLLEKNIENTSGSILVIGVGNSCGIGDNEKAVKDAEQKIKSVAEIMKKRIEAEKKQEKFWNKLIGG